MTNETLTQKVERDNLPREGIVGKGIAYERDGVTRVRFGQRYAQLATEEERVRGRILSGKQDSFPCNYDETRLIEQERIAKISCFSNILPARLRGDKDLTLDSDYIELLTKICGNELLPNINFLQGQAQNIIGVHSNIGEEAKAGKVLGGFAYFTLRNRIFCGGKSDSYGPVNNLQEVVTRALEGSGLKLI
jgi:hypothetical protein